MVTINLITDTEQFIGFVAFEKFSGRSKTL